MRASPTLCGAVVKSRLSPLNLAPNVLSFHPSLEEVLKTVPNFTHIQDTVWSDPSWTPRARPPETCICPDRSDEGAVSCLDDSCLNFATNGEFHSTVVCVCVCAARSLSPRALRRRSNDVGHFAYGDAAATIYYIYGANPNRDTHSNTPDSPRPDPTPLLAHTPPPPPTHTQRNAVPPVPPVPLAATVA